MPLHKLASAKAKLSIFILPSITGHKIQRKMKPQDLLDVEGLMAVRNLA